MKHSKQPMPPSGTSGAGRLVKDALIGGGIGLALIILTVLISPFAMLGFGSPNALALPFAAVCVFLGGAAGSALSAKRYKESPIAAGLLSAGIIALPLVIVALFLPYDVSLINLAVISVSLIGSALIGSITVSRISSSRKRNMKKALKRR